MNGGGGTSVPSRWRQGGAAGDARSLAVPLLLVGLAVFIGMLFVALPYLRPPSGCRYAPICISSYRDASLMPPAWRKQDVEGIAQAELFRAVVEPPAATDFASIMRHLDALPAGRNGLVVHLCGLARLGRDGRVLLLPSDADADDPATWLPLARMLEALRQVQGRRLLLILDLEAPPGTIIDDIAAAIPGELDAVADPRRLVLLAGDRGQKPKASEVLGRSAFGHYLEEGLRGGADASGDGHVSAKELAAYVRARVDRWSRAARGVRQTPVLLGEGRDFTLVDLPNGTAREPRELNEDNVYPEYLLNAWKKAGGVPERLAALTAAERAWRDGTEDVQDQVARALTLSSKPGARTPPVRSLARAFGGRPADTRLVEQLRALVVNVEQKTRGQPAAKAAEIRPVEIVAFVKSFEKPPGDALAWAALEVAIADARPDVVRLLDAVVRTQEAEPASVETLALRELAEQDLPRPILAQALEAVRGIEVIAGRPRVHGVVREELSQSSQALHESMVLLSSPGYASSEPADKVLKQVGELTRTAQARQATASEALALVEEAREWLPRIAAAGGEGWQEVAALATQVADILLPSSLEAGGEGVKQAALDRPALKDGATLSPSPVNGAAAQAKVAPGETPSPQPASAGFAEGVAPSFRAGRSQVEDVGRLTTRLRERLDAVKQPFTATGRAQTVRAARRGNATATQWREVDGLLATSLVEGSERGEVWKAAIDLARRLEGEVIRLDVRDGIKLDEVTPAGRDSLPASQAHGKREVAILSLRGLPVEARQRLAKATPATPELKALLAFDEALRQASKTPAVSADDGSLWAFLADRYRYLARESAVLGREQATTFYRRAAEEYRPWLKPVREEYVDLIRANDPPRLLPDRVITQQVEVRPIVGPSSRQAVQLSVLTPDAGQWLKVTPAWMAIPPGESGTLVPLQISLTPTAGRGKTPMPKGIVVQAKLGERAFHRKLDVPLAARGPEILLSATEPAKTPGANAPGTPPSVRLRAGTGRESLKLYLRNPTDKVWNKLVVKLRAGSDERTSAVTKLEGGATKAITFPPAAVTVVAAAPATPAAAPAGPAPLPALEGPITVSVLSQDDRDEEVAKRTIEVEIARPEEYVQLTEVRFDPGAKDRVETKLRLRRPIAAPPVTASLRFAPTIEGGAIAGEGTLTAKLPETRDEVSLFAQDVKPPDGTNEGLFAVSVDGWERAFLFAATLGTRGSAGTPRQLDKPAVRIKAAPFALAGPSFIVPLEVDNAPADASIVLNLGRVDGSRFVPEATARRATARERRIGFNPSGPEGAMVFEAALNDWSISLDTTRIRGPRQLRVWLVDANNKPLAFAAKNVTLGDRAPTDVEFITPPTQVWQKAPMPLKARSAAGVVGVKEVFFFFGKPAGDKVPDGVAKVAATATDATKLTWTGSLPAANRIGQAEVSVQFVNQVGLSSFATINVELTEVDPKLMKPASIRGAITEGDRPQAGVEVVLSDDKGAEKGKATSKKDGSYVFADVPPGKYRVSAAKPVSGRSGSFPRTPGAFIEVKPGTNATAPIVLYLRGG